MTRCDRSTLAWLPLAATVLTATAACTDLAAPTAPAARADVVALAPTTKQKGAAPKIRSLALASTLVEINGPAVGYTLTIQNNGSDRTGVFVQGEVVQGSNSSPTGGTLVTCPGQPIGTVPSGGCTMSSTMSVSSSAPGGANLVPGSASWGLSLYQDVDGVTTLLDSKKIAVTLLNGPTITSILFTTTNVWIYPSDPVGTEYTVTIANPGPSLNEVFIQGTITQDQGGGVVVTHGAGGTDVFCPTIDAVLPNGTCTMTFTAVAENSGATGSGQFVEGPATFILELWQGFTTPVLMDRKTVALYLSFPIT